MSKLLEEEPHPTYIPMVAQAPLPQLALVAVCKLGLWTEDSVKPAEGGEVHAWVMIIHLQMWISAKMVSGCLVTLRIAFKDWTRKVSSQ